jgi:hypothetical protein
LAEPPILLDSGPLAEREGGIVATDNVRHLALFVPAMRWRDIPPEG